MERPFVRRSIAATAAAAAGALAWLGAGEAAYAEPIATEDPLSMEACVDGLNQTADDPSRVNVLPANCPDRYHEIAEHFAQQRQQEQTLQAESTVKTADISTWEVVLGGFTLMASVFLIEKIVKLRKADRAAARRKAVSTS